jgi:hypothetical protein
LCLLDNFFSMHTCRALQSVQQLCEYLPLILFSLNSTESSSVHTCTCSMPTWQSSTEFSVTLSLCASSTQFPSKVFNNLEVSLELSSLWCTLLAHSFLTQQSSDAHSLRWLQNLQCSVVHSLHSLKNPEQYFKLNKDREIYLPTADEIYHTSTTYINTHITFINTHKHTKVHMQEKLLSFY